jgi:hypothetical protein
VPHDEALEIRDDVAFFQAVRAVLARQRSAIVEPTRIWTTLFGRLCREPWRLRKS